MSEKVTFFTQPVYRRRDGSRRAAVVCALLAVDAIILLLAAIVLWRADSAERLLLAIDPLGRVRYTGDLIDRIRTLYAVHALAYLAAGVAWLVWEHGALTNCWAVRVPGLRRRPSEAVWWWFVPFASAVMPFLVVRELRRASSGQMSGREPRHGEVIVWAWWGALMAAGVLVSLAVLAAFGALIDRVDDGQPRPVTAAVSIEELGATRPVLVGGLLLFSLAAVLAIAVVRSVERRQRTLSVHIPVRPDLAVAPA